MRHQLVMIGAGLGGIIVGLIIAWLIVLWIEKSGAWGPRF